MRRSEANSRLAGMRAVFRARIESVNAPTAWEDFPRRIAVVLFGGGAHGAYEAGALLALQDAQLPTHIISAASVGSINAAGYAARSDTLVGDAEHLVESWLDLTPPAVGIEWTRYVWMLVGFAAASVGFGNLIGHVLANYGFSISLHEPGLAWLLLGMAGAAVLLLYDYLPYIGYVIGRLFRSTSWRTDRRKAALSIAANLIVWGFLLAVLRSLRAHVLIANIHFHPKMSILVGGVLGTLLVLRYALRGPLRAGLHRWFRLPLRSGLFANFERAHLLRQRISVEKLRASPIRVVFTATDLESGAARFFCNRPTEEVAADPGVDSQFVAREMATPDDLMLAIIASSALPIAYEPIRIEGRLYADGGIVGSQPIRPALHLGADVLFLVWMVPVTGPVGDLKTFVDIGLRSLDIVKQQNLLADLKTMTAINAACERTAAERRVRPEEIEIAIGNRRHRYIKIFTVRPSAALPGTVLDFNRKTIAPAVLQGYRDACVQIDSFLNYVRVTTFNPRGRVLHFVPRLDTPAPD